MFENDEMLQAKRKALIEMKHEQYKIPIPPTEKLIELLTIILEHNDFTFDDKTYKQVTGVPMGGGSSAELADIRMHQILDNILKKFKHKSNIILCKSNFTVQREQTRNSRAIRHCK